MDVTMEEMLKQPLFYIFTSLGLSWIVASVSYYWYKARRHDNETTLKMEMLQRGMSADDIERVINVKRSS
jgi:hypothetical protein